jgi:thiol:disulfide interchange protein DsbA
MLKGISSKWLLAVCLLWPVAITSLAANSAAGQFVEGQNYIRLEAPLPTLDKSKIEVVEFFWYGCIHCYHFEPSLSAWQARQPDDVQLVGSPVAWSPVAQVHARAFYTAQVLGVLDKVHEPLFAALNTSPRSKLDDEDALAKFFAQYGVPEADFRKAFNSFGVTSLVRQADARVRSAQVDGTPSLLVNGKYRVSAKLAGGMDEMLSVVDFLIDKERALLAAP